MEGSKSVVLGLLCDHISTFSELERALVQAGHPKTTEQLDLFLKQLKNECLIRIHGTDLNPMYALTFTGRTEYNAIKEVSIRA